VLGIVAYVWSVPLTTTSTPIKAMMATTSAFALFSHSISLSVCASTAE
jgi:hypothetical protein